MNTMPKLPLILLCVCALNACASTGPVERRTQLDTAEIARALRCSGDEIAFCADVNCEPEDYHCVARSQVLGTIFPSRTQ